MKRPPTRDNAGRQPGEVGKTNSYPKPDYTETDRLSGRYSPGNNARNRHQERGWTRRRQSR